MFTTVRLPDFSVIEMSNMFFFSIASSPLPFKHKFLKKKWYRKLLFYTKKSLFYLLSAAIQYNVKMRQFKNKQIKKSLIC